MRLPSSLRESISTSEGLCRGIVIVKRIDVPKRAANGVFGDGGRSESAHGAIGGTNRMTTNGWPTLGVMVFTYNRFEVARRTIDALLTHAHYSGPLRLHIADDGSPPVGEIPYLEALGRAAIKHPRAVNSHVVVTAANSGQRGYGASYNLATQIMHSECPVLMPLEDDWELQRPLDLDPLVRVLLDGVSAPREHGFTAEPIRCIRLGYIGYTNALRGEFVPTPAGQMLLLDAESPERHVFAGHARIETRDFERSVGPWPEMLPAGEVEFEIAGRHAARRGVAWPLDVVGGSGGLFAHIGSVEYGEHTPTGGAS